MAPLSQHMRDCRDLVGDTCEDVNRWMDDFFSAFGPYHRFKRHHREGIQEAEALFGKRGRRAAIVHILRDCRNVPRERDYQDGTVDRLGLLSRWPVTAYIHYPEDAFERLAMYSLNGPEAIINLGFINSREDLQRLLATQAAPGNESQRNDLLTMWPHCVEARNSLPPLVGPPASTVSDEQKSYAASLLEQPLIRSIQAQFLRVDIQRIDIANLINPLVWIDLEYVEQLRAELSSTDDIDVIRVAIPTQISFGTRIALDSDGRGVSVVSEQKQVAVSPPTIEQVPGTGMVVKFDIVPTPQVILVGHANGRYFLKNGMHRAYLLASAGVKQIPAVVVEEPAVANIVTMYPAFNVETLGVERPPVIADMFNDSLTAKFQILRTKKIARIRVEELLLPID